MSAFGYISTMMNHVAISLDRLNAITRPTTYMSARKPAVLKRILAVWSLSAFLSSHQLITSYPDWPKEFDGNLVCPMSKVLRSTFYLKRDRYASLEFMLPGLNFYHSSWPGRILYSPPLSPLRLCQDVPTDQEEAEIEEIAYNGEGQ